MFCLWQGQATERPQRSGAATRLWVYRMALAGYATLRMATTRKRAERHCYYDNRVALSRRS